MSNPSQYEKVDGNMNHDNSTQAALEHIELTNEATPMLAEKFILLMETLKSHASPDGAPRVVSTSPHVPVKLPAASNR
jgi:hypothetical protein